MRFMLADVKAEKNFITIMVHTEKSIEQEKAELVGGDVTDFLNDKYLDKEINAEWPEINRKSRAQYHIRQAQKLLSDKRLVWNEHGTGVK